MLRPVRSRFRALTGASIVLLVLVGADRASAHNTLESSVPSDGASLVAPAGEWLLDFVSEVPLASASAEVVDSNGVRRSLPAPVHGIDTSVVRFTLPDDLVGSVTARWRLVSSDGHVISGRVGFTVTSASASSPGSSVASASTTLPAGVTTSPPVDSTSTPTGTASAEPASPLPEPGRWFVRLGALVATLALGGLLFSEQSLAPGILATARARTAVVAAAATGAGAAVVQLLVFLGDVNGTSLFGGLAHLGDAFSFVPGSMMLLRVVIGVVMVRVLLDAARGRSAPFPSAPMFALFGMHLVTLAWTGHSRSQALPLIGIPVDVVHTAAAAAWLGGLAVVALLVVPVADPAASWTVYRRFGATARIAVPVIVGTGVVQSLRLHGGIATLFTTGHGRLLLLKIAVVAAMLKVADINRRRLLRPDAGDPRAAARRRDLLVRASLTEAVAGGLVVAVTAALVAANPG
jgi:copper transport protein